MLVDVVVNVLLELGELLFQETDGVGNGLADQCGRVGGIGLFQAVAFALQILGDRLAAGQQGLQDTRLVGGRCPRPRVKQRPVTGKDNAVDTVIFGADTEAAAEVFDLRRVDNGHHRARIGQRQGGLFMVNARAFHDRMEFVDSHLLLGTPRQQVGNPRFGIGDHLGAALVAGGVQQQATIEFGFRHINADEKHKVTY